MNNIILLTHKGLKYASVKGGWVYFSPRHTTKSQQLTNNLLPTYTNTEHDLLPQLAGHLAIMTCSI